ncbi:MAG: hypothetical protein ACM3NQ_03385 [Bacteroidales bacterium]
MNGHLRHFVRACSVNFLVVVAFLASAQPLAAQQGKAAGSVSPSFVSVRLVSLGTVDGKATGIPSAASGTGTQLRLGESVTLALFAGSPDDRDLGGQWGSTGGAVDPKQQGALHLWVATVTPTKLSGDDVTLAVDWKRFDAVQPGQHEVGAGAATTIALKSGERYVLDFVRSDAARRSGCESALIQLEASVVDEAPLANATLAYDLWLVDQDQAGHEVTRHMQIAGKQRETLAFRFFPAGWSTDGSPTPDDRRPDIAVEVSGTLRGRLLGDGTLEIVVTPSRTVREGAKVGTSGYRETTLTARPGETIRMDVPSSGPAAVRSHRTSLTVTVRAW